jgi:hypothetical protein
VFQQGEIDFIGGRVALTEDPGEEIGAMRKRYSHVEYRKLPLLTHDRNLLRPTNPRTAASPELLMHWFKGDSSPDQKDGHT